MKRIDILVAGLVLATAALSLTACGGKPKVVDEQAAAPPTARVQMVADTSVVTVNNPGRIALVTAGEREELPELNVTAVVNADVSRQIPVIALVSGRVIEVRARLGDYVTKGQLLLRVLSDDISAAFQNYNHARADEALAKKQLERAKLLYEHGAIALSDYEIAEDTEQKAKVDLDAAVQHIRTLGADLNHEDPVVSIYAPITGTIVDQQITRDANIKTPDAQAAGLFTIADLSHVWVICDVYESDLATVQVGDVADVQLNAYPDRIFHGQVSNIGQILDPAIRTAKVRVQLNNPGIMRVGMFATATFHGKHGQVNASVPTTAVLHLHDRDWVFVPSGQGRFRRTDVTAGKIVGNTQDVLKGIAPGQQVVNNALALDSESQQQ